MQFIDFFSGYHKRNLLSWNIRPSFIKIKSIILVILLLSQLIFPEIRYVSKTGSSTPPYLSWETSSDSIQKCINISNFGDTIYVGNGVYKEKVVMIDGLALIGSGNDSCIINTGEFTKPRAVNVRSNCIFKNFKIIVQNSYEMYSGEGIVINYPNSIVEYNEVQFAGSYGIWCYNTNSVIKHNKVIFSRGSIEAEFNEPIIDSNYIYIEAFVSWGIGLGHNSIPVIRGNIVIVNNDQGSTAITGGFNAGGIIENNTIYGLAMDEGIFTYADEQIINNTIVGNFEQGIQSGNNPIIKNNTVSGGQYGLWKDGTPNPDFRYNNVWNNQTDYFNFTPDSTNISADPMFVNEDSLDFHLQMYSPLIDAGDPTILDKDSSRSDIGAFGGPYGESYNYMDLAPRAPMGLTAIYDTTLKEITIKWKKNTEADFNSYFLFRDTIPGFSADTTTLVINTKDTFYVHIVPPGINKYYYKMLAIDNQGNPSELSEELPVIITSSEGNWQVINDYKLFQNYPNPFNPTTKIGFRLKNRGYVKLYVYDVKGEIVSVLVNEEKEAGYYEIDFSADNISSGLYLYQIMIKDDKNLPVYTEIKKMLHIK